MCFVFEQNRHFFENTFLPVTIFSSNCEPSKAFGGSISNPCFFNCGGGWLLYVRKVINCYQNETLPSKDML